MEIEQLENTEEDTFDFSGIPLASRHMIDEIDELKQLIKKNKKNKKEIGRMGVLKQYLNLYRLSYTDIIFEHTFHSVKVNERYLLDNLTLENVIVSFHCNVVGLYNESDWYYKNTNVCNFEVVIEPPKFAKTFIEFKDIKKSHFMEWAKDKINDAEKYIYESIKNNTFKYPYVKLPRFFLNDELEDENRFTNRTFPLKFITDQTPYTDKSDLLTIYKQFPCHYFSDIRWDVNTHLILCDYIVGALQKHSKEYIRQRLINRHNRKFHNHSKKDNIYLNVFDFYFAK